MKRPTLMLFSFLVLSAGMLGGYLVGRWQHRPHWRASQMPSGLPPLHRFPAPAEGPPSPLVSALSHDIKAWTNRPFAVRDSVGELPANLKRFSWTQLAGPGTAKFQPADSAETKVTFDAPGDYLLRLTAGTDGAADAARRDIAARVQHAPLDLWKQKRFTATALATRAVSGDSADPDRDGISNLVEYALMLDPLKADVGGLPDPTVRKGRLHLTYRRPASAVDLRYKVQWTDDMKTWHDEGIEQQIIVSVGNLQVIQASAALPADRPGRFMRLEIVGPEP